MGQTAVRPRFIGPPFLPGRSRGRSASRDTFSQQIPTTGEDFQCPRPPPRKGGEPEAGIRARIMSISRALGADKPAAKRPRSYMEGPCGGKLSIMSTILPNTPSQKSKKTDIKFFGGYVRQYKGAHHVHQQGWGQKSKPPNALEATWKDPVAEKQTAKIRRKRIWKAASRSCIPQEPGGGGGRARARPPPFLAGGCTLRVRDSFYIFIYLYLLTYPSIIYIYIHLSLSLSLSLFEQVKLLERA